ncbi:MAG: NosD domain-containing protein [Candidatus Thorarchaeota archaeon]
MFSISSIGKESEYNSSRDEIIDQPRLVSYSPHQPIIIRNDSDFDSQGWPGLGTQGSPYIIEDLNITTSVTSISVANTSKFFVIRDCWLSGSGVVWGNGVVTFDNVSHGTISTSNISAIHSAITIYDSANCSFTGNQLRSQVLGFLAYNLNNSVFSGNSQGHSNIQFPIHVQYTSGLTIRDNLFSDVTADAIRLAFGFDCTVEDNYFQIAGMPTIGQFGLIFRESLNGIIRGNVFDGFESGIEILYGIDNQIDNNTLYSVWTGVQLRTTNALVTSNRIRAQNMGIDVQISNSCIIELNDISGVRGSTIGIKTRVTRQSLIRWNEMHEVSTAFQLQGGINTQVIENNVYDCLNAVSLEEYPGIGYEVGPPIDSVIANNTFVDCGILFQVTDPSAFDQEITGNIVNGGLLGYFFNESRIVLNGADFEQIILAVCSEVVITSGELSGITLFHSEECEIVGVTISQAVRGIYVLYSTDILFSYIEARSNEVGIYIDQSTQCSVYRSIIQGNGFGILFDESLETRVYRCQVLDNEDGIMLIGAHGSAIESNSIRYNGIGIYILRTNETMIGNNEIVENELGIYLNRLSGRNHIIGNVFDNLDNALCTGSENRWDNEIDQGNSWSDLQSAEEYYYIDDDDIDHFPSFVESMQPNSTSTGISNTTKTKGLFELSPQQAVIASGMFGGLLVIFTAVYARRRFGR